MIFKHTEATPEEIRKTGLDHRFYLSGSDILVVLVHGKGGNHSVMWPFTKTLKDLNPNIVSVQAPINDPDGDGYVWWTVPTAGSQDSGDRNLFRQKLLNSMPILENFIKNFVNYHQIRVNKVYTAGFSQGGVLCSSLSFKRPELFSKVAILASLVPSMYIRGEETVIHSDKDPHYYIFHGTEDQIIPFEKALSSKKFLESQGFEVTFVEDSVGHKLSSSGVRELQNFFNN